MLKIFVSLCYAGVLHKLRSVGIFDQVMASFHYSALINSFTRFWILVILQGTRTSLIQYQVLGYQTLCKLRNIQKLSLLRIFRFIQTWRKSIIKKFLRILRPRKSYQSFLQNSKCEHHRYMLEALICSIFHGMQDLFCYFYLIFLFYLAAKVSVSILLLQERKTKVNLFLVDSTEVEDFVQIVIGFVIFVQYTC